MRKKIGFFEDCKTIKIKVAKKRKRCDISKYVIHDLLHVLNQHFYDMSMKNVQFPVHACYMLVLLSLTQKWLADFVLKPDNRKSTNYKAFLVLCEKQVMMITCNIGFGFPWITYMQIFFLSPSSQCLLFHDTKVIQNSCHSHTH